MRWRNGGGWTTEVIAWPDQDDWEWRLSVADIEHGGPFSTFPGVDRTIALLQGNGFVLTTAGHPPKTVTQRYEPFEFPGDASTTCALLDGAVQDLNLMVRRTAAPRQLSFIELAATVALDDFALDDFALAIVVSGQLRLGQQTLSRLDAIRPTSGPPSVMVAPIGGQGASVAVVRTAQA
jgi:uncharacterized protein